MWFSFHGVGIWLLAALPHHLSDTVVILTRKSNLQLGQQQSIVCISANCGRCWHYRRTTSGFSSPTKPICMAKATLLLHTLLRRAVAVLRMCVVLCVYICEISIQCTMLAFVSPQLTTTIYIRWTVFGYPTGVHGDPHIIQCIPNA